MDVVRRNQKAKAHVRGTSSTSGGASGIGPRTVLVHLLTLD